MLSIDDVAALLSALPEVTEGERYGHRAWSVTGKVFSWERPFSKADLKRFGAATPPAGPVLAISTADLGEREALLAAHPLSFFTIPHFDGFAAVLVDLSHATEVEVREALLDGWLAVAPARLTDAYDAT